MYIILSDYIWHKHYYNCFLQIIVVFEETYEFFKIDNAEWLVELTLKYLKKHVLTGFMCLVKNKIF